ncbi:MAG: DUF2207 domain-containing protein, partial [Candidatus Saccharibacteria bacterium]
MIKNRTKIGFVVFIVLLASVGIAAKARAGVQDFTIGSFKADYFLQSRNDGVPTVKVDEVINANFPTINQNHGIFRAIPNTYKDQPIDLKIQSISNADGVLYPYTTSSTSSYKILKIGDAATYVDGPTSYHLVYSFKNPITFYSDHDEWYWDVNGTQWNQVFGQTSAVIHVPRDLVSKLQDKQVCYTGTQGSTAQDCTITRTEESDGLAVTVRTENLPAGGNLSFVLSFKPGTFKVDKAAHQEKQIHNLIAIGAFFLLPVIVTVFMYRQWSKNGRDAKGRGTIVPQYVPLPNFNSLTSDVIIQQKLRNKAVTALIIELAVRGYISISEIQIDKLIGKKIDYELKLLKTPDDLTAEERAVVDMVFSSNDLGSTVQLLALKNTMSGDFLRLSNSIPETLASRGYFKSNPVKVSKKYQSIASGILVGLVFFGFVLVARNGILGALVLGAALAALIMLIFSHFMSARTATGVEALEYLEGLRMYMQLAEADRIRYLQSPEGVRQWGDPKDPKTKLKLFEKLLPFAIIFEMEKNWANEFADVYSSPPDWYHGNWTSFNTGYLIGSISTFNNVSQMAFAPPSSSSG